MEKNFHQRLNSTKRSTNSQSSEQIVRNTRWTKVAEVDEGGQFLLARRLPQKALNYRIRSAWPGRGLDNGRRSGKSICDFREGTNVHFTTCVTCDGQVEVVDKGARSTLNLGGEKWNEGCAGKKKKEGSHVRGGALLSSTKKRQRVNHPRDEIRLLSPLFSFLNQGLYPRCIARIPINL